ncbi:MAG: CUAEP/CCAEP-tail radical SAM (seleno)protein, partial [Terriglobia bacterium]
MRIVLISTYELGHQPFGLASPQAWLAREGHTVTCADVAVEPFPEPAIRDADLIAFYLPMHTATRLAMPLIGRAKKLNPGARLACYGLYAPINAEMLRSLGVEAIAGGEFESSLVKWAGGEAAPELSFERQTFLTPTRASLPPLNLYAKLHQGEETKMVGYTEASRGCKHLCRHCPVVPVYQGKFRVVGQDAVLADIRQQIAAGAQHITFGDPDFLNGPKHAMEIVHALHDEFPQVTYDATIKIEHLRKHRDLLKHLHDTGCLFVTSAVESVDNAILERLDKGHTRADFLKVVRLFRETGLSLQPTFVPFTPWTTLDDYLELLNFIEEHDLIENVDPVHLSIRLLVPPG